MLLTTIAYKLYVDVLRIMNRTEDLLIYSGRALWAADCSNKNAIIIDIADLTCQTVLTASNFSFYRTGASY